MGELYYAGIKVKQDLVHGYAWIGIVAAGGYKPAEKLRDEIESHMTIDEREKGHTLAKELWGAYGVTESRKITKREQRY